MSKYEVYPVYKDSGVEWLGNIPEHWEVKKLKFIAYAKPSNIDKKSKENEKSVLLCNYTDVYYNDFITNKIDFMKATATDEQIKKFTLEIDDVIITKDSEGPEDIAIATCVQEIQDGLVCGYHLTHIKPTHCNGRYLFRAFNSDGIHDQFKVAANGITRYGLGVYGIDNARFPLPPLQEQQTIANYLDKATAKIDTLIEKQTKLIELLKEKRQAVISTAVTRGLDSTVAMKDSGVEWLGEIPEGWELTKLRYVFSFSKGLTITKANLVDKGIPCVNYGEIHSKYGFEVDADKHVLKCVDNSYLRDSKSSLLSMGDFVFADTSEDIEGAGNFTHVSSETQIFAGYHTVIARQVGEQSFRFLAYLIDSETFRMQIRLAVKGVKVFSITQAILRGSIVWLPKIGEQQTIANYLDTKTSKIDKLITKSTKAIDLLKEKRTALISSAVTGKIDVRGEVA